MPNGLKRCCKRARLWPSRKYACCCCCCCCWGCAHQMLPVVPAVLPGNCNTCGKSRQEISKSLLPQPRDSKRRPTTTASTYVSSLLPPSFMATDSDSAEANLQLAWRKLSWNICTGAINAKIRRGNGLSQLEGLTHKELEQRDFTYVNYVLR